MLRNLGQWMSIQLRDY